MDKTILDEISNISLELRLPAFRIHLQETLMEAIKNKTVPELLILSLLESELRMRLINRKKLPNWFFLFFCIFGL